MTEQDPEQDQETRSILVKGQQVEFQPLPPEAMDVLFQRLSPKQRLALSYTAKGFTPREIVAKTGITPGTFIAWRKGIPGYRDAYYHLQSQSSVLGVEAVRSAAVGDALQHYETLHRIATDSEAAPRDQINATKETLTLAGAYKGTNDAPMSIGDILVQINNTMDLPAGGLPGPVTATEVVALVPGERRDPVTEADAETP